MKKYLQKGKYSSNYAAKKKTKQQKKQTKNRQKQINTLED